METMQFKTEIDAPVSKVFDTMLGEETYKLWTAEFNPTSDFEGSWTKGSKILFTGVNKEGKKEGMIGMIKELDLNKFVSIEYIGLLDGENEITEGPLTEGWIGGFENYTYEQAEGKTNLSVSVDVNEDMRGYFIETYPKALARLKEICEA